MMNPGRIALRWVNSAALKLGDGVDTTGDGDIFAAAGRHLRAGSTVAIDIGDSSYAGVHVATDAILTDAGLLSRDQRGKWAYFRVEPERVALGFKPLDGAGRRILPEGRQALLQQAATLPATLQALATPGRHLQPVHQLPEQLGKIGQCSGDPPVALHALPGRAPGLQFAPIHRTRGTQIRPNHTLVY